MNSRQNGFFFWGFPWFFIAVLLFLSVIVIRNFTNRQNTPEHIFREAQEKTLVLESELKKRTGYFITKFDTNARNGFHPKNEFSADDDEEKDKFLFVFKYDSLIYWNNSQVILPLQSDPIFRRNNFACLLKNGWYGFHREKLGSFNFLGCYLIKTSFNIQNEFIHSDFSPRYNLPSGVSIENKTGPYPIYSSDKSQLFCLNFDNYKPDPVGNEHVLFILFLLGSLCLYYFLFCVFGALSRLSRHENLRFVFFGSTLILLRFVHYITGIGVGSGKIALFGPALYSSSAMLPSLGDFLLNVTVLLVISLAFFRTIVIRPQNLLPIRSGRLFTALIPAFIILFFFQVAGYFVSDLVLNSSLSLNLQNISGLSPESGYGLYIIGALFLSLWLISARLLDAMVPSLPGVSLAIVAVTVICLSQLFIYMAELNFQPVVSLFFLVYLVIYWYFKKSGTNLFSVQSLLLFLCFYALFGTFLLNRSNQEKETGKVNLLAVKLATRRNPVTEVLYEQIERRLMSDSVVANLLHPAKADSSLSQDSLSKYIKTQYFKDYWMKYQVQVTFCDPQKELKVQPQGYLVNCNSYFRSLINSYGESTAAPNLFFLDYGIGKEYYLAVITAQEFGPKSAAIPSIFIEFNLKNVGPDLGYPGLLMDKSRMEMPNRSDYSYGLYQDGRLIRAVGPIGYKMELSQYKYFAVQKPSFPEEHITHFHFRINGNDSLLISKQDDDFLALAAPFPYLFILFSAMVIIITMVVHFPKNLNPLPVSLRNRLLISLIGILVMTMLAIGIMQVVNILRINATKNIDSLREKTYSVVVEIQHKYSLNHEFKDVAKSDLEDFLVKLSNVFFSDINIFNARGLLVSSSRPQIFEEGLLSARMNAAAFRGLVVEKNAIFIHNETIGSMRFNSAYLPFYNGQDELLGFVNLPYFARQDESKQEISSFLVTFINVYIILILFGVFITVLISKYITAPLALLAKKMSLLRLGMVNEKIPWSRQDEIGQLVAEYNRMIEELERSANMLASSERERAWREMARQIAHEIKNPLTPMKLSAQYLEKAWLEKAPDWDQRLARFTKTIVEQIDALSVIATDFSDFAKMPEVNLEKVDLEEVIQFVLGLYLDTTPIRFEFKSGGSRLHILADRSQIIRVFTNLLNNAVQAIDDQANGVIMITLEKDQNQVVVIIEDNGCGIPGDRRDRIFQPDFTTKTSGMGLGLAIVKAIMTAMNGEIGFTSKEGQGTVFIIKFPINDDQNKPKTI